MKSSYKHLYPQLWITQKTLKNSSTIAERRGCYQQTASAIGGDQNKLQTSKDLFRLTSQRTCMQVFEREIIPLAVIFRSAFHSPFQNGLQEESLSRKFFFMSVA
jgi:hypothetical protein